jgi:hypothetical protein
MQNNTIEGRLELEKKISTVENKLTEYSLEIRPIILDQLLNKIKNPELENYIENNIDPRLLPQKPRYLSFRGGQAQKMCVQYLEKQLEHAQFGLDAQSVLKNTLELLDTGLKKSIKQNINKRLLWKTKGWVARNERYIACIAPVIAGMTTLTLYGIYGIVNIGIYLLS